MEWRLDFVRAEVPEELDGLKAATARLCDNMVQEIEGFSFKLHRDLKQAIVDAQSGDKVVLQITLTLTSPGTDEIANETQRLKDLIISGGLA